MRQAALLKMKRHAEEQIAEAEAKVRGHYNIIIMKQN